MVAFKVLLASATLFYVASFAATLIYYYMSSSVLPISRSRLPTYAASLVLVSLTALLRLSPDDNKSPVENALIRYTASVAESLLLQVVALPDLLELEARLRLMLMTLLLVETSVLLSLLLRLRVSDLI